jgi:general secretion pathway protein L
MLRRYIALQPGSECWNYVLAAGDATGAGLQQAGSFVRDAQRPLADQLTEIFGPLHMQDRLACALPGHSALLRRLEFPFDDPRKIAAALEAELQRQLPEALSKRTIFQQSAHQGRVLAAAVSNRLIEETLGLFDDNREPLGFLGLAPLCYAAALEEPIDRLLLCADADELSLCRLVEGQLVELRLLPGRTALSVAELVQQAQLLAHSGSVGISKITTLGLTATDPADTELVQQLRQAGFSLEPAGLKLDGQALEGPFQLLACLALTAVRTGARSLNLRSGPYQLKNDWLLLKRRSLVACALFACALLLFGAGAFLNYQQQSRRLQQVKDRMVQLYQQQFPSEKLLVPPPLQLQSKMKELQKKTAQFGAGGPGALETLRILSQAIDPQLSLDIRDYVFNDEGLRLTGSTENFDAVSRLLAVLKAQPPFKDVRMLDSKQAPDGQRVDFQMQIQLADGKGA